MDVTGTPPAATMNINNNNYRQKQHWRKAVDGKVGQQSSIAAIQNTELQLERRRLLALVAECDEALKLNSWYTVCVKDADIAIFANPDGPIHGDPLYYLCREYLIVNSMINLLDKLTGPQGRVVPLSEISGTKSWRAGTQIEKFGGDYDSPSSDVVVYRSDVAGEYVMSYNGNINDGWHLRISHENLVDLLEDLIKCCTA